MKSKEEIKEWLLENCVNKNGDLDLSGLDFSDFNGNIYFNNIRVKNSLCQCSQYVGRDLYQSNQFVGKNMFDCDNVVNKHYMTQTLKDDEEYETDNGSTYIVKKEEK